MNNAYIHPVLKEIAAIFSGGNKEVYLVGGAVRDTLRGEKPQDWDLATNAVPDEVAALFRNSRPQGHVIPTGIKHGTVTVRYKGHSLEVTTFRTESDYQDGRRPGRVAFASTIEEDLSRRDFTMNAAAMRLPGGGLVDPFGGTEDIKQKLIRCVGKPAERFGEDGLRPLRAVRFAAQLGFSIEAHTLRAIAPSLSVTARVSPERIRDELDKILSCPKPSVSFRLMEETGLLGQIIPCLAACRGVEQKGFHHFDVLDHSLLACDYAARERFPKEVILACLFHDIGKPLVRGQDKEGNRTFYRHEAESSRLSLNIMTHLRYPNAVIEDVCHLVKEHMFHYEENWTDTAIRRFIIRVGEENLENLYRLRRADAYAMAGTDGGTAALLPLIRRVDTALAEKNALSLKDLAVTGKDLIAAGIKPGKTMGIILNELMETVVDDPRANEKENLLTIAGKINRRYSAV